MLVEEVRSKVKVQCTSIIAGFLECSLLAAVGHGSSVRHPVLHITVETYIVLGSECIAEDHVLPVRVGTAHKLRYPVSRRSAGRIHLGIERPKLHRAHDRNPRRNLLETYRAVVCDLSPGSRSLFSRNQDNSVRGSRAVYRGRGSILENCK